MAEQLKQLGKVAVAFAIVYFIFSYFADQQAATAAAVRTEAPAAEQAKVSGFAPIVASKTTTTTTEETTSANLVPQPPPPVLLPPTSTIPVSETAAAQAAPVTPAPSVTPTGFSALPMDYDALFDRRGELSAADLLPKNAEAELFADVKADPEFDKSFLQNRWLSGIDVSTSKRGFTNDLRGAPPPVTIVTVSPFNQPTQFRDQYARSIKDIC